MWGNRVGGKGRYLRLSDATEAQTLDLALSTTTSLIPYFRQSLIIPTTSCLALTLGS